MSDVAMIKEFLVRLGFKIDADSEKKFSNTLASATVKAIELGAAVSGAAATVVAGVAKIAEGLEQLYFTSERVKASVENIQSFGFAMRQMGGSAEGAVASLESVARLLRNSPGGEGLLKNIGIQTRDANGNLRDTVEMMSDLGKKFAEMPYYRANAYAQALGIDEKSLMALRKGADEFSDQYKQMLHAAGLSSQEAAKSSHVFMNELRLLQGAVSILTQKVASSLTGNMAVHLRQFRELFVNNFGQITESITKTLAFFLKVADAISILAMRGIHAIGALVGWFNGLSEGSKKVIEWIGAILVAWRLLSAGFLATPLGRLTMLITTLALLWDDYKVWKEGGKSFIDWSAWAPGIEAAISGIKAVIGFIQDSTKWMGDWQAAFDIVLVYFAGKWTFGMLGAANKVATRLATSITSGLVGLATNAALLAAAAGVGYAIGSAIYKAIENTDFAKGIGHQVTKAMAALGNQNAKDALAAQEKADAGKSANEITKEAFDRAEARKKSGAATAPVVVVTTPVAPSGPTAPTPERSYTGARGLRNNNPGNINYGSFAKTHGSTGIEDHGGDSRFATFGTAQEGLNALADLLRQYVSKGTDTVRSIISKYAPAGDHNDTAAYIANVAKRVGVDADQKLDLTPQQLQSLIAEIVKVENGKNPYSKEMIAKAAERNSASPGGKTDATVSQVTHITVHGATDPKTTAADIAVAQNDVNERLTRNMRGAVTQ